MQTESLKKATRARKRKASTRRRLKKTLGDGSTGAMREVFQKAKLRCVTIMMECEKEVIAAYEHHSKKKLQKSEQELVFSLLASAMLAEIISDYSRQRRHDRTIKNYLQSIFTGKNYSKLRSRNG